MGAVAVQDDALLLVRRGRGPAAGEWSVPGGRVEMGETLHVAVVREVLEETGLEVVVDRFLGWVERIEDCRSVPLRDPRLRGDRARSGGRVPVAGDDAAEVAWVPLHELSELRLVDGLYDFLRDVEVLT